MSKACITRLQSLAHTCLAQPAAPPTVTSGPMHVLKRPGQAQNHTSRQDEGCPPVGSWMGSHPNALNTGYGTAG